MFKLLVLASFVLFGFWLVLGGALMFAAALMVDSGSETGISMLFGVVGAWALSMVFFGYAVQGHGIEEMVRRSR